MVDIPLFTRFYTSQVHDFFHQQSVSWLGVPWCTLPSLPDTKKWGPGLSHSSARCPENESEFSWRPKQDMTKFPPKKKRGSDKDKKFRFFFKETRLCPAVYEFYSFWNSSASFSFFVVAIILGFGLCLCVLSGTSINFLDLNPNS